MNEFIFYTVMVALLAAFLILLITKFGLREWMQVNGTKLISDLANCDFCLSFWVGLLLAILLALLSGDLTLMFIPICSTPLTRKLL